MTKYLNTFTIFLLVLLSTTPNSSSAQETTYTPGVERKIEKVVSNLSLPVGVEGSEHTFSLKKRMAFYNTNGVSIAVINNYKIEWARGFGWADSAGQRPVTAATLFQAGSVSKSLNAVGVLKLVQDKKLDLSADINEYLKSWKFSYDSLSKGKKITIANLLSHTAGLSGHGFKGYQKGEPIPTLPQLLNGEKPANTAPIRSIFEPGLRFQYSGGGTMISQQITQDITGKAYDNYMWKNVLKPMGMLNSSYTQPPAAENQKLHATAFYSDGKPVPGNYLIYPEQAAAGLWTNPTDLARYVIETQLALQGKSEKVLSQEMTKLRLTPFIDNLAALGVYINKKGEQSYFQHAGVDMGFVAVYYGSMEGGNGVVVMANTLNEPILMEVVNSVAEAYNWKGFYQPQVRPQVMVKTEILDRYVGKYVFNNENVSFVREGAELILIENGQKINMHFTSDTEFFLVEIPDDTFNFTVNSENNVDGFQQKKGETIYKFKKNL